MELQLLDWIQSNLRYDFFDQLMTVITALGNGAIIWIIIAACLLVSPKNRKAGIHVMIAVLLGYVIGDLVLKNAFGRARPFVNIDITLLISKPLEYSFPSGHTLSGFAASVSLLFYSKKLGLTSMILASIIAFSRLYLYVHYPTDILGGIIAGVGVAFLGKVIIDWIYHKGNINKSKDE